MTGSFVSPETRRRVRGLAVPVAMAMGRMGLTPNALTVAGFLGTCLAAAAAASQLWAIAGVLVIGFGIFDLFDGALARATGRATKFGAFLDSTADRTGESLVLAGVAVGCAASAFPLGVAFAALALAVVPVVTYTRAKAEALGLHGDVGVAPRPERLVILAAGLVLGAVAGRVWLTVALALLTILASITIVQRVIHTKRQLDAAQP